MNYTSVLEDIEVQLKQLRGRLEQETRRRLAAEEELRSLKESMNGEDPSGDDVHQQYAQRLESLGVMARGIAHDFNHLLMTILSSASLAISESPVDSPVRKRLHHIKTVVKRASELTRQMLAYSGKAEVRLEPIELSDLVEEMKYLLGTTIPKQVEMVCEFDSTRPIIRGDATQIRQVVLNLITNAAEAVGDSPGTITVRTGLTDPAGFSPSDWNTTNTQENTDRCVFLEVTDTGKGLDEETKRRMFDPFFTTKAEGRGLGLSVVFGIVRAHGGVLAVESGTPQGTTFRACFPHAEDLSAGDNALEKKDFLTDWRGSGTILLEEEEAIVRNLAKSVLEERGFQVVVVDHGHEAAHLLRNDRERFSALILSGSNTKHALREVNTVRGDIPILLLGPMNELSGELETCAVAGNRLLPKPFHPMDLVKTVRAMIEGEAA